MTPAERIAAKVRENLESQRAAKERWEQAQAALEAQKQESAQRAPDEPARRPPRKLPASGLLMVAAMLAMPGPPPVPNPWDTGERYVFSPGRRAGKSGPQFQKSIRSRQRK